MATRAGTGSPPMGRTGSRGSSPHLMRSKTSPSLMRREGSLPPHRAQ